MRTACIIYLFSHIFPFHCVIVYTEPKIFERLLYITRRFAKNSSKNAPFWG